MSELTPEEFAAAENQIRILHLHDGEQYIPSSPDYCVEPIPGDVPFYQRANISQKDLQRVRSISLNLAAAMEQEHKDPHIRAEIRELRLIFGIGKVEKNAGIV